MCCSQTAWHPEVEGRIKPKHYTGSKGREGGGEQTSQHQKQMKSGYGVWGMRSITERYMRRGR